MLAGLLRTRISVLSMTASPDPSSSAKLDPSKAQATPQTNIQLLGLGLLSTALAYQIYFHILAVAGATNLLLVTFLIPISATLLGTLFLQEHLDGQTGLGMVLILTGLLAIDGRLHQLKRLFQHLLHHRGSDL